MGEKKLTDEELEKQIQRLTYVKPPEPIRDPFPLCQTKTFSQADCDKCTERLFYSSLKRKEATQKELEDRVYERPAAKKLSGDEIQASVDRQYSDELERRKINMEELRKKYLFHSRTKYKEMPLNEIVQRMYDERIEKKKATEQKLYEKYIVPTEPKQARISRRRIQEASVRLSTKD